MSQYVLEWSKKQNAFHIQPVEKTLASNQQKFIEDGQINDYHVLFVGEKQTCETMAENWRERLTMRSRQFAMA
jgi:hypothetical protein